MEHKKIIWKISVFFVHAMIFTGSQNTFVTNIFQNTFFYVAQKKVGLSHSGLKRYEGE